MRSIPILFTPLPVNAPLKHNSKLNFTAKPKANTEPHLSGPVVPAKVEMAIDHLPPSLRKICEENSAFAHALKIDLAGVTKAAYEHDSDMDSDDDEYQSEGLRFKRYVDKMHGIKLNKEAYRFIADNEGDGEKSDEVGQDVQPIPTIWGEDGKVNSATPNDQTVEEAIGDVSAAYRVTLKGRFPVTLKDEDEPVLADEEINWALHQEDDLDFPFDQDVIDTPDLSSGNLTSSPPESPFANTPSGSPCISRTKSLYNIQQADIDDEDDHTEAPIDTPPCPAYKGATKPSVQPPMIPFDPRRSKYAAYATLVRPREFNHEINTIYEESMTSTPAIRSVVDMSAIQNKDEKRMTYPSDSGVLILRNGQPIYGKKRPDHAQSVERDVVSILKPSDFVIVKLNRSSVRFNPKLDYSSTSPPVQVSHLHRPATYRNTNAGLYRAALRNAPIVPEPIGAPLMNLMIDAFIPIACSVAKNVQIGFNTTVKSVSDAIDGWVPAHPGMAAGRSSSNGRRLARIHKGLNF